MFDFKTLYKKAHEQSVARKRIVGTALILLGFFALLTPMTPGAWLIFVGFEFFGIRLAVWDRIKKNFFK
jgi:uncharacterized protein YqgC (DUF456 family)